MQCDYAMYSNVLHESLERTCNVLMCRCAMPRASVRQPFVVVVVDRRRYRRCEGAQGWNDGREAVKRQAYRVFNVTRVAG